ARATADPAGGLSHTRQSSNLSVLNSVEAPSLAGGHDVFMQWTSDFRHAWRALLRTPGFLVTSVVTLALAIGAVVGMFSVVNTVLLRPLPFPDPERLVVLSGTAPGSDLPERFGLASEFYVHYKERSQLLDGIFIFGGGTSTLRADDRVERVRMAFPTND